MPKQRGVATAGQLRLRTYRRFSDIPPRIAGEIISKLGIAGGKMRRRALQHNPRVIVALEWIEDWNYEFDGWRPIGWLSLHPVGALHKRHRYIQTFVADKARRRGLGSRMMVLCKRQWLRSSETVMVSVAQSKAAATFYKKNGFT